MSCTSISYPHQLVGALATREDSLESAAIAVSTQPLRHCQSQSRTEARSVSIAMATCYTPYEIQSAPAPHLPQRTVQVPAATAVGVHKEYPVPVPVTKDYSRPLHVDCSVEYELPNAAKPPQGVRNEPLLMIHPCYFRKIESQRRSPFVNNLPPRPAQQQPQQTQTTTAAAIAAKRRMVRAQQMPPQPHQAAPYPIQYGAAAPAPDTRQLWEPMPPLVPITAAPAQPYCKVATCGGGDWTAPDLERSPDRPEDKHILSGKYRQYLRGHRLHPYVSSAIPLASTFPQLPQQVCYNV